ncbi:carboxylating nicotinate-nucleotide diphosphorylase [bacterium SCSIO 12827]|nr:carboxylating nicotinate-nucleotide diphosphorylase [bacterium SCSIO 12827]
MTFAPPDPADIKAVVDAALTEDIGEGDVTTRATVPAGTQLTLDLNTRQDIVVCGMPVALEVFRRLAPDAVVEVFVKDGDHVAKGTHLARLTGTAQGLLSAERTALNLLQKLSGIATMTRQYVDAIDGTGAVLLDTRKTIPGLRGLSKYAVRAGGGTNHRMRLDDGILIKDNHVAVCGGSVGEAVTRAKNANTGLEVRCECDTLDQVREAVDAGADSLLLDNMPPPVLREAVAWVAGRVPLEASGGVKLDTIRAIAETGVNYISVGGITQSAPAVDIGLDLAE